MQSLYMALSVSVPLLIYMAIGAFMRSRGIFSREQFTALNGLSFRSFLPVLLFKNVASVNLADVAEPPLVAFVFFLLVSACVLCYFCTRIVTVDPVDRATVTQGSFRTNYLLFGTIMAEALCDDRGLALLSALATLVVPLVNILSVILFERCRGGKLSLPHLLSAIIKNPLVLAGLTGAVFSALDITLPAMIMTPINGMAAAATPVALVALGGVLSFDSMKSDRTLLLFSAVARLLVIPLLTILVAVCIFGYRGNELVSILAVSASPTAVASAPTAQVMGGNGPLASEIVAVTSTACIVTIFIFVFVLSSLGLV